MGCPLTEKFGNAERILSLHGIYDHARRMIGEDTNKILRMNTPWPVWGSGDSGKSKTLDYSSGGVLRRRIGVFFLRRRTPFRVRRERHSIEYDSAFHDFTIDCKEYQMRRVELLEPFDDTNRVITM